MIQLPLFALPTFIATAYLALPAAQAVAAARRLPAQSQLSLAVALSARVPATDVRSSYRVWLRMWEGR